MPAKPGKLNELLGHLRNPAWLCFVWFGATAAISLVATPARFAAATATRTVALDIGREVFEALNRVELGFLILLLVLVRVSGQALRLWPYAAGLVLVMLAQSVWLLPELSARTDLVVAGIEPPPSSAHAVYGATEVAKLLLLLAGGFHALSAAPARR